MHLTKDNTTIAAQPISLCQTWNFIGLVNSDSAVFLNLGIQWGEKTMNTILVISNFEGQFAYAALIGDHRILPHLFWGDNRKVNFKTANRL